MRAGSRRPRVAMRGRSGVAPRCALRAPRLALVAGALALAAASEGAAPAADPGPAGAARAAGTASSSAASVRIDSARWESGYGLEFFQVVGTLTNESSRPLAAVQVRTELLDASGAVVDQVDVWNARAEALGDATPAQATHRLEALGAKPLAPGESDRFRATFLKDETPPFEGHRVRLRATVPAD